jgi:hypothetical protein
VDRALLMAHKDMLDRVVLKNLGINRQHSATGVAKDRVNALIYQSFNYHFRTSHVSRHCIFLVSAFRVFAVSSFVCRVHPDKYIA